MLFASRYWLLTIIISGLAVLNAIGNAPCFFSHKANSTGIVASTFSFQVTDENGHFVVIGAFKSKDNANKLIRKVQSVGFEPKYFFNEKRNLFYVYIFIYDNVQKAYKVSNKLREVHFIDDAWVFSAGDTKELDERFIAQVQTGNKDILTDVPTDRASENNNQNSTSTTKIPKEFLSDDTVNEAPPTKSEENKKEVDNQTNQQAIDAIKVDKKSAENSVAIMKMGEAKQGDLVVFDNILFHKNSSVLRKLSKDELGRLQSVLANNPKLAIKIHGHTNGDFKGEVYLLADYDSRFFKLSGKNQVVKGDDILLSQKRAEVIKRYLVEQGVAASRIETKGWGHKRMLYPKEHFKASQNRRVEIEILGN